MHVTGVRVTSRLGETAPREVMNLETWTGREPLGDESSLKLGPAHDRAPVTLYHHAHARDGIGRRPRWRCLFVVARSIHHER